MDTLLDINNFAPLAETAALQDLTLLVVRILFGGIFLYYGLPKIKDLQSNATDFEQMGFSPGMLWGTLVALLETVGSVAIMLGVLMWFFAACFVVHMMMGAFWKITKTEKPFTDWSYDLALWGMAILFLLTGPGSLNLIELFA